MFDPDILEACTQCLVVAATYRGTDIDLRLGATALARDLADAQGRGASELLDAAAREAVTHLDASDLDAVGFATALRRLSFLRARVHATLRAYATSTRPLTA